MANYDSAYTGQQIDDAILKMRSLTHSALEIDTAVTKFDSITSTPSDIDDAVNYIDTLGTLGVNPSDIDTAVEFVDDLTVDASDVNSAVATVQAITSTASQIDDAVDIVSDNSASAGQVLTADGVGGSSWVTPDAETVFYHHTAVWTKVVGSDVSRFSMEWIDTSNTSSATSSGSLITIGANFRSPDTPKIGVGFLNIGGNAFAINGIYFDTGSTYVLIGDDYPSSSYSVTDGFASWTFKQYTYAIG